MTEQKRGNETIFGIASLVLGIVSLLLFCTCFNWITGILAIVFGSIQLVKHQEKAYAITGMVTAVLSLLFSIVLFTLLLSGIEHAGRSYEEFYRDYFYGDMYDSYDSDGSDGYPDWYDEYDDYDNDDFYDYFDDYYDYFYEEGGQEFL